jgi:hypothetical protein
MAFLARRAARPRPAEASAITAARCRREQAPHRVTDERRTAGGAAEAPERLVDLRASDAQVCDRRRRSVVPGQRPRPPRGERASRIPQLASLVENLDPLGVLGCAWQNATVHAP